MMKTKLVLIAILISSHALLAQIPAKCQSLHNFLDGKLAAVPSLFAKTPSPTGQKLKDLLSSLTSVEDTIAVDSIQISVYPNPIGAGIPTVALNLTEDQYVQITVADILGRKVAEVFEGSLPARKFSFQITQPLEQGYYFVIMRTDTRQIIMRLVKL